MLLKNFFKDKDDNVIIGQFPNLPLIGWFVCMVITLFIPLGFLKTGFYNLSNAFLFLWAYLEITQGVNYFRRLLGVIVMTIIITAYFTL